MDLNIIGILAQLLGAQQQQQAPDGGKYGFRYNSTEPKGEGYLGPQKVPNSDAVMTELSIGVGLKKDGKIVETEIPTLVPTLTKSELNTLLNRNDSDPIPKEIAQKAIDFAQERVNKGLPVWATKEEEGKFKVQEDSKSNKVDMTKALNK